VQCFLVRPVVAKAWLRFYSNDPEARWIRFWSVPIYGGRLHWRAPRIPCESWHSRIPLAGHGIPSQSWRQRTYRGGSGRVRRIRAITFHFRLAGLVPLPAARSQAGVVSLPDGRVFGLEGWDRGARLQSSLFVLEPPGNEWVERAPMPTGDFGMAAATDRQGRIYAFSAKHGSIVIDMILSSIRGNASPIHR